MPDIDSSDSTLSRLLGDIAESGRSASRPVPPGQIRRLARRRQARRRNALGAVTAVAVAGSSWGVLGSGSDRVMEADGGPTPTASPVGAAEFGPATLVSRSDVSSTLGTMWGWSAGAVEEPTEPATPCQGEAAADPGRTGAVSRVVTGGWSGDDTVTELVEQASDPAAAEAAFARAVGWFTDCGGLGVDQSDANGSLAQRFESVGKLPGVDEQAVVVRRREHLGTDTWTNTVAGVLRVDDLVAVIAWDVTIDDDPGAYDDGFLDLMQVAAGRLTGVPAPRLDPGAMLQPDDEVVAAIAGDNAEASGGIDREMRPTSFLCGKGRAYSPDSLLDAQRVDVADKDSLPASVSQFTYLFVSKDAAATALQESRVTSTSCTDLGAANDEASSVPISGGDEGYALRSDATGEMSPDQRYVAVVRVGPAVSVIAVHKLNGTVSDGEVTDLVDRATERMYAAYGTSRH